ncbi:sarcosine oxidase subunit alpha family protein [Roseibaca sp. V10]|uniref:Sarcosine oxidase subunit alpha family protein n=1 Tax=Roseinatronobacter domitianus TaxID=2940293 RepID=A0ABT0M4S5_9RHOB|nr:sarcosine oxidase subunit alpha family protein [Roseibaca domitiana]MCL1629855.1 sarcosine oxidase subunit alpha family protein [Roseibaca domitiana]
MRLPSGGQIDRSKTLRFTFDGAHYRGHPGDTLASALLANGVRLMGRSFKYHRPRGPIAAGSEEPNALVTLGRGGRQDPNTRATVAELFDGLEARSQNAWPSLRFDAMAINDGLSPFLTAGFYYKTFMWPAAFWEKLYEPVIRRAAGLGAISTDPDPDSYDKGFLHCDLLVIGAGPSGLMAALTAARGGARVILADEDFTPGGRLNASAEHIDGQHATEWAAEVLAELSTLPNVRILPRTTVFGAFDHGIYGAVERVSDHLPQPEPGKPRQTLWRIYSKRAVLCAGALERPIAFADNDRPGIMLAGALAAYAHRWAVSPASRVAIFTNNDSGHTTARDLLALGVDVRAVIDTRADAPKLDGAEVIAGGQITGTRGRLGLSAVQITRTDGRRYWLEVGALGVSGGWNPNVALSCHQRGRPVWQDDIAGFVPGGNPPVGMTVAGAAAGQFGTHAALSNGAAQALAALGDLGIPAPKPDLPKAEDAPYRITPFWHVGSTKRAWLDFQNDVTVKDVKLAHQEGFRSVEHLKRYTTLGMATDQGKTSNLGGLAVMAELTGQSIEATGTTIFRPPYTPVAMGALAGRSTGADFKPTRKTPSHVWASEQGATFVEVGQWLRAQYFPQSGETHWRQTVDREVNATRTGVGICDVTTLGKIDVQGADAAAFLNRIYCNAFAKLAVGRVRYGLMLREDGIAMDDGTAARLAEDHFVVTTTTANAVPVYRHMEFARQCLWPDMDVQLISTTEAWAQVAIAGPKSRELLERIVDPAHDLSNDAFPFMGCADITVCGGLRARLFRISFSGELAYELAVPTRYGDALMRRLMDKGADLGVTPYGTEALGVMRIEKGHAAGNELNGTTTARNLGLGRMVSTKKDSIGAVLSRREGLTQEDGLELVGLRAVNPQSQIPAGAHILEPGAETIAANDLGYATSACYSPTLGSYIALAFVKAGSTRMGARLRAASPLTGVDVPVEIVSPHFVDPEGERLRA